MNIISLFFLGSLTGLLTHSYYKFYNREARWLAPHPIVLYGLLTQMLGIFLQCIHLYGYSYDGTGYIILDVLSKVSQGFSEVTMTLLLILLASGWKLKYQEIDFDEQLEVYLPLGALVLMV
jgi:hypothetical protein